MLRKGYEGKCGGNREIREIREKNADAKGMHIGNSKAALPANSEPPPNPTGVQLSKFGEI